MWQGYDGGANNCGALLLAFLSIIVLLAHTEVSDHDIRNLQYTFKLPKTNKASKSLKIIESFRYPRQIIIIGWRLQLKTS